MRLVLFSKRLMLSHILISIFRQYFLQAWPGSRDQCVACRHPKAWWGPELQGGHAGAAPAGPGYHHGLASKLAARLAAGLTHLWFQMTCKISVNAIHFSGNTSVKLWPTFSNILIISIFKFVFHFLKTSAKFRQVVIMIDHYNRKIEHKMATSSGTFVAGEIVK